MIQKSLDTQLILTKRAQTGKRLSTPKSANGDDQITNCSCQASVEIDHLFPMPMFTHIKENKNVKRN